MVRVNKVLGQCVRALGTVGSLFVRRNAEGRYEIAVTPLPTILLTTSVFACTVQDAEPFRQCVQSNLAIIQEFANAF